MPSKVLKTTNKKGTGKVLSPGSFIPYPYLIVFLVPVIFFFFSIRNGFVYFDDDILVLDNQSMISDLSNIIKVFHSDAFLNNSSPYYRPMLNVSFMIDARFGKSNPAFYHFMNLFYHGLCCISLLWLLQLVGFSRKKAFACTLVFSVHPLMANTVFWIPARSDLLVALFGILFFSLSIKYARERKPVMLIGAILCFTAALFSKESAVLLPFLLFLYFIMTREKLIPNLVLFAAPAFVIAGWFYLRSISVRMIGPEQMGIYSIIKNLPFPFEILSRFFFPFNLPVTPVFSAFFTCLGILIAIAIPLVYIIRGRKMISLFLFGIIWYIAFSLPNMFVWLNTTPASYEYLVHRAYFPVAGLLLSVLLLIPEKWTDLSNRRTLAVFLVVTLVLVTTSILQGRKYHDAPAFWNSAIRYNPERAWFYHFLGRYYFKQKDYVTFERYTRKAVSLKTEPWFLYNLAMICFVEKKQYDSAFIYFNRARATGFTDPEANRNYINLCLESARDFFVKGEYNKAVERCGISVSLDPSNPIAAYNMGLYLIYSGERKKAAAWWRRSLVLNPELKEAYLSLYYYYRNNTTLGDSVDYYAREYQKRGGIIKQAVP